MALERVASPQRIKSLKIRSNSIKGSSTVWIRIFGREDTTTILEAVKHSLAKLQTLWFISTSRTKRLALSCRTWFNKVSSVSTSQAYTSNPMWATLKKKNTNHRQESTRQLAVVRGESMRTFTRCHNLALVRIRRICRIPKLWILQQLTKNYKRAVNH